MVHSKPTSRGNSSIYVNRKCHLKRCKNRDVDNRMAAYASGCGKITPYGWQPSLQSTVQLSIPYRSPLRDRNLGRLQEASETSGTIQSEMPKSHYGLSASHQRRGTSSVESILMLR
ncbi:hypothetical protein ElyMa_002978400 [Elysia marginata]|uniref:Uncharacterized protein n=1 Tax=Elysia marginata TaxID=1093978 RepID=A0AAV4ID56_9GAST|nr:hypothetical protein ElyMa_002978400 [Elysia marginata]